MLLSIWLVAIEGFWGAISLAFIGQKIGKTT